MSSNMKKITNLVLFKIGWISCVLFGASQYHLLGSGVVVLVCLVAVMASEHRGATVKLIIAASVLGFAWESALLSNGLMEYQYGLLGNNFAPHWIIAMWALFASTLDCSLVWLKRNFYLASVFGAIGGPLAFFAGERLAAVIIPHDTIAMIVLAIGWAILTPCLLWLSNVFIRNTHATRAPSAAVRSLG